MPTTMERCLSFEGLDNHLMAITAVCSCWPAPCGSAREMSGFICRRRQPQAACALQKQMGGHTDVYAVDNHSCVINAAMEELAKPERSVEQKTVKKNTPER